MDNNIPTTKPKKKRSKKKFLITFFIVMGFFAAIRYIFKITSPVAMSNAAVVVMVSTDSAPSVAEDAAALTCNTTEMAEEDWNDDNGVVYDDNFVIDSTLLRIDADQAYGNVTTNGQFNSHHQETTVTSPDDNLLIEGPMVSNGNVRHNAGMWSYSECFPDSQSLQIEAAQRCGITPVPNRNAAQRLVKTHALVNISHSPLYRVDTLKHSMPYLVPQAQQLLNTIGMNFIDSCQAKGLPVHLPIVTSVLRTVSDVDRLQHGNRNATTNSCHCYGTTVDIAYNKFYPLTTTYSSSRELTRWDESMKRVLAEVLFDLRERGMCYVKYERKQACFHLTCR